MSACKFSVPYSGSANEILNRAKMAIENRGGNFSSDASGGNFRINLFGNTIKGSYKIIGQNLDIIIDTKPLLVPCSVIEGFLKNQIG